jgi:hypothetical protein
MGANLINISNFLEELRGNYAYKQSLFDNSFGEHKENKLNS